VGDNQNIVVVVLKQVSGRSLDTRLSRRCGFPSFDRLRGFSKEGIGQLLELFWWNEAGG
jgi:hypothetical protein